MLREGPANERVCTWEAFTPLNTLILPGLSFPGTHNLSPLQGVEEEQWMTPARELESMKHGCTIVFY